jgi:hypothetical protein
MKALERAEVILSSSSSLSSIKIPDDDLIAGYQMQIIDLTETRDELLEQERNYITMAKNAKSNNRPEEYMGHLSQISAIRDRKEYVSNLIADKKAELSEIGISSIEDKEYIPGIKGKDLREAGRKRVEKNKPLYNPSEPDVVEEVQSERSKYQAFSRQKKLRQHARNQRNNNSIDREITDMLSEEQGSIENQEQELAKLEGILAE